MVFPATGLFFSITFFVRSRCRTRAGLPSPVPAKNLRVLRHQSPPPPYGTGRGKGTSHGDLCYAGDFAALYQKPDDKDAVWPEHPVRFPERQNDVVHETDDRHHQDMIKYSCPVRQGFAGSLHGFDASLPGHREHPYRRVEAVPDPKVRGKPAGTVTDLEARSG